MCLYIVYIEQMWAKLSLQILLHLEIEQEENKICSIYWY
jgi:hypothetical protein